MNHINKNRPIHLEDIIPVLITSWQSAGHAFGVDNYLQLRQIQQQLSADKSLQRMKYLLAPIFANTPQKQEEFYELFDIVVADVEILLKEHEDRVATLSTKTPAQRLASIKNTALHKWENFSLGQRIVSSSVLVSLVVGLLSFGIYNQYFAPEKIPVIKHHPELFAAVEVGTKSSFCIINDTPGIGKPKTIELVSVPGSIISVVPIIDHSNICFATQANKTGRDKVVFNICYSSGVCNPIQLTFLVDQRKRGKIYPKLLNEGGLKIQPGIKVEKETAEVEEEITGPTKPDLLSSENTYLDTMIMSRNPSKAIQGVTSKMQLGKGFSYISWPKARFLALMAGLLLLIGWWIKRRRQKFTMDHQPNKDHPYVWNLRIPFVGNGVDLGNAFNKNLRSMLRRDEFMSQRLDVKKTINASLKKGGAVDFKYLPFKHGRQYLILLDISSQNNHRSKILDLFIEKLQESGAPIEYYFFDGDPRHCWNNKNQKGTSLRELVHSYQNYYLIYCSDGQSLIHSSSEQLAEWTTSFSAWRKKIILTPILYNNWDQKEAILSKSFRLLPSTPNGISFLVDSLESVDNLDYEKLTDIESEQELYSNIRIPPNLRGAELIEYLETEFATYQYGKANDVLLRWIAACSIPPVLFWHWTLYIGELLSDKVHNYLSLENLFQIIRLPWFIDGKMDEDVRLTLVNWLEEKHPYWLAQLRREWDHTLNLEENLPPLGSIAWEGHRIEIILNELLQDPAWAKRRKLELELEKLMLGKEEQDAMVIKYLDKKSSSLEAVLSNRFRQFVQEKVGLFWRFRMWVWQLPVFLVFSILTLLIQYSEPVITFEFGDQVTSMTFVNDSKSFLVANGGGGLALCTVEGQWIQGLEGKGDPFVGVSNSLDSNKILAGSSQNTVSQWDISGVPLLLQKGRNRLVKDIAFHPLDPNIVLIACFDKKAELWDIDKNKMLIQFDHDDVVNSVSFSPTGEFILTGSSDRTAKLWKADGALLKTLSDHKEKIYCVAFSPNGNLFATGSRDNTVKVWNIEGGLIHTLKGHKYDVFDVSFSPDGNQIATASGDDKVMLWSANTGRILRTLTGHRNYATNVSFSPNGNYLLTGDREGRVKLWTLGNK